MRERLRLVLPHSVMLLVSIGLYWAAMQIDAGGGASGGRIGPDFWPKAVIAFMGLLCAYEIVKRLVVRSSFTAGGLTEGLNHNPAEAMAGGADAGAHPTADAAPATEHNGMLAAGVALIVGYVLVVPWLGFFLTTALFLAAFIWIGGFRRPLLTLAISGVGAFILVVIFMRVAYISLPLGQGPFQSLSTALMTLIGVK